LSNARHGADRRCARATPKEILGDDPHLPHRKGEAGEHHELREVATSYVLVSRNVDREVPPPLRRQAQWPPVGRNRYVIRIPVHALPSSNSPANSASTLASERPTV